MINTQPSLHSGDAAELVIDLLTGNDDIDHIAHSLGVPTGRVRGWCERIRTTLIYPEHAHWRSETGDLRVTHTAHCDGLPETGAPVTFTVEVVNETLTTLYGVHLVQRTFTNAAVEHLEFDTAWQFVHGTHAQLAPGDTQRYVATYRPIADDFMGGGEIINAIAITGYTASGQQIWVEQDALVDRTGFIADIP